MSDTPMMSDERIAELRQDTVENPWSWYCTGTIEQLIARLDHEIAERERLRVAATDLLGVLDVDGEATADEGDEEAVGWNGDGSPMPMTFGHVRRLTALSAKEPADGLD